MPEEKPTNVEVPASPAKKSPVTSKGKIVLARVTLLDGSILDVNIEVVKNIFLNTKQKKNFSYYL